MEFLILTGLAGLFVVVVYFVGYAQGSYDEHIREVQKKWGNNGEV